MFILPACENLELKPKHFYFISVIAGRKEMWCFAVSKSHNLFSEL